ncbi:hypothetical protein [Actinokineospora sp. NBRC 105648]|uniref:hypothetical protein n=1 Tax=Actinokineospora sp. NBRC 105648 TaxID=3032206 RepID=UPI0024A0964B|nr:hypothetical protein [Actinokineospora sp. NBRC 105648]GLZ42218.1 hypothetical protein Acsp05_58420 [Actinokineospora sp. NBRC 105648]
MVYRPSALFRRTPQERADQWLSWNRADQAFFAAGACHILAFAFLETHPDSEFHPVGLWAHDDESPLHIYVTDGEWAFDHDGWTPHAELLAVTRATEPGKRYQPRRVERDLTLLCERYPYRARHQFAHDPWQRALHYLARFPPSPGARLGVGGSGVVAGC